MSTVGTLHVNIGANLKPLTSALDSAITKSERFGRQMVGVGQSMSRNVTVPLVALGGAALASVVRVGNLADELLDLEQQTGLSTDRLQEFRRVATVAGVGADTIASAAEGLTMRLRATGEESAAFAQNIELLGISTRNAGGGLRSMDDLLPEIIRSLQGMDDITTRNAVAAQIFGRRASELAPILGLTVDQMDEAVASAHALGLVMSRDSLEAANQFREEWDTLKQSLGASVAQIGLQLIPVMTTLVNFLQTQAVPAVQSVVRMMGNLSPATQKTIFAVGGLVAVVGPLLAGLGKVITLLPLVKVALVALTGPIGLTVAAVVGLTAVWLKWGDDIKRIVGSTVDAIRAALVGRFTAIVESVRAKVEAVTGFFRNMYERVVGSSYVPDMMDGIRSEFARLDEIMVRPVLQAVQTVQNAFASLTGPSLSGSVALAAAPTVIATIDHPVIDRTVSALDLFRHRLDHVGAMVAEEFRWAAYSAGQFAGQMMEAIANLSPLQALGAFLGEVLEPMFQKLAPVLAEILAPLRAFGELLAAVITPALRLLAPVIRAVSWALSWLVSGIGWTIRAIGKLVDSIPGLSAKSLIRSGQAMIDAANDMRRGIAGPVDEVTDALIRFKDELLNAPRAFNLALLRHTASAETTMRRNVPGPGRGQVPRDGAATTTIYNFNIASIDAHDRSARELFDDLEREAARRVARGGTTRFQLAMG
jgi:hypothetical protein